MKMDYITQTPNGAEVRYTPDSYRDSKEKDTETGYSYPSTGSGRRFGARHYDSELSVWLSVDPMADKYPSTSGYNYCAGNPVMLIDPNGMETIANNDWYQDLDGNYVFDESVNENTDMTGKGTYLGKSNTINVKDENSNYNVNLLENGEYELDKNGEQTTYGRGTSTDFGWGSGHNVSSSAENYQSSIWDTFGSSDPALSGMPWEQGQPVILGTLGILSGFGAYSCLSTAPTIYTNVLLSLNTLSNLDEMTNLSSNVENVTFQKTVRYSKLILSAVNISQYSYKSANAFMNLGLILDSKNIVEPKNYVLISSQNK